MQITKIPFQQVPMFSDKDVAYATESPKLKPFYKYPVNIESFKEVIEEKKQENIDRETLHRVLRQQYEGLEITDAVRENIDKLKAENTFTIVTAHQPSLFTGPLYYVYKIISTINLVQQLNEYYPDEQFVPIFVSGGEDHDFEEVNHAQVFSNRVEWNNEESGSVGMMKTDSLKPVLEELKSILGESDRAVELYGIIEKAYTSHERYSQATQDMVNALFGKYGLVALNMNHPDLKRLFIPIMREEILQQPSHRLVEATQKELEKVDFSPQAFAREINLFYLDEQIRERIVLEDGQYKVLNTDLSFSEVELMDELEKHPEHFSPNVVMRPLFQEVVLPNLAYIGGGGEIAYWLERKSQFAHFGVKYPMLIRRNSVLWIDKGTHKKMEKLELSLEDLMMDVEELIKLYVSRSTEKELTLEEEKNQVEAAYEAMTEKAASIDPTLAKAFQAEQTRQMKSLDQLESRLMRAEKQRHEVAINQIRSLKDKLFPNNGLQERVDNFMPFFLQQGWEYFDLLLENLDPLVKAQMVVVTDN